MVRIHHAPGVTGTFTDDEHGTFDIEDGIIECDDAATAEALVDGHRRLSWADGPPESDATPGVDAPETGSQDGDSDEDSDELSYEERTALAEGLANEHWRTAVSAVEDGDADAYLDTLAKVDGRDSVQAAIKERQEA